MRAVVIVQVMEGERLPNGPLIVDLDSNPGSIWRMAIEEAMLSQDKLTEMTNDIPELDLVIVKPPCQIIDAVTIFTE